MSNNLLRNAIRSGLRSYGTGVGVSLALVCAASPAIAQDTTDEASASQLQTITVTGSRIRKAEIETAQPIVVIDRQTIEHQGFNSVADILQNLTEAGTPPISRTEVLASGEDVGGYYVDLRNLGANRTLILLNGKRLGTTTSGLQDLSQIPIAAIERMEVLKDGASSLYGSDAIAGVINIITRSHYDGAQADAYVGQYDQDDGEKQTYSMTFGASSDRGSITLSAEYAKEDPVWARNRWFSESGATDRHPGVGTSIVSQNGAFFDPFGGWCGGGAFSLCTLNPGGDPFNAGVDGGPSDYHPTGTADRANPNQQMMLATGIERHSVFANADYSITDNLRFTTDILYNKRETLQQVAGYPFQPAFTLPGVGNPYIGLTPGSYFNPFGDRFLGEGEGATVYFYRRGWEVPRTTDNRLTTYRISGGLEGTFDIGEHTWNWDVGGFVNKNDLLKVSHGDFSLIATSNALGPSFLDPATGLVTCGTPDNPLPYGSAPGSCIPWNPLLPYGQAGDGALSNPILQQYLFPYYHDRGETQTTDYTANITGGVFTLPAGELAIAAGYEHRREEGNFIPDAFSQAGLSTNLSSGPTGGSYDVDEYYIEVDIPLLKDVPFAQELTVNVANRWSDYSTFGDTSNGKVSLTWRPIEDLLVRGNYAEGFRAPQIADLYGGISGTFDYYIDPCDVSQAAGSNPDVLARCTGGFAGQNPTPADYIQLGQGGVPCTTYPCQTGIQNFAGSTPTLQPETATSKTLGIVYSPGWFQGLDLSLDWYRIRIENSIGSDSITAMLNDCYRLGVESRCSTDLFTRDPATGVINYALRGLSNAGWTETQGYDFGVAYRLPEFSFGRFVARWNTTYTDYLNSKADDEPTTPVSPFTSWGGNFRIRSNASLDWTLGDFGATWTTRYYSSMKEECSFEEECNQPGHYENGIAIDVNRTGANTFHDVQLRYSAPWKGTFSVGANNLFNHFGAPMYSGPNSQYSYYGGFDIGRFYYLRYQQTF
jgi:iron complex outermembrane receptor protein